MNSTMGVGLPALLDSAAYEPEVRSQTGLIGSHREPGASPRPSTEQNARLASLLRQHYASVWRLLRRVGVPEGSADDAAQEVFIVAARKLEEIQPGCERTYLLSSALRVAANHRRSAQARYEVSDDLKVAGEQDPQPSPDQLLDRKRLREAFDRLVASWPEDIRTAFVLFELEGLSVPEIAELTSCKAGTVASRLRRARELFQAGVKRLRARGSLEGGSP